MGDDAMTLWERELGRCPEPEPPRNPLRELAVAIPLALGACGMGLTLLLMDFPPDIGVRLFALSVVLPCAVALVRGRGALAVAGAGAVGFFGGFLVAGIVIPVLIVLDFLECWMSWLSDC